MLRTMSDRDEDVDFRRVPRGDWDGDHSAGHCLVRRAPGKGRRRVTTMLSWISREFFFFKCDGQHRGYPTGSLLTGYAYY